MFTILQAKIYDRDAHTRGEFIRGDMYIRDMKNTKVGSSLHEMGATC